MGKVTCKVCGTSYPETATQCPICGYVNPANSQAAEGNSSSLNRNGNYQYVKGGRFSKANVKKRSQGKMPPIRNTTTDRIASKKERPVHHNENQEPKKPNEEGKKPVGMIVTSVVLILAIIAVVIYLSLQFFGPKNNILPDVTTTTATTEPIVETKPQNVVCQSVTLNVSDITFDKLNASRMLYATTSPDDVNEPVTYISSNEAVATVTQAGMVTAVGPGEAIITVSCGNASAQCVVTCESAEETTAEETTVPEETTIPKEEFTLNRKDMTFSKKGEVWVLYDGSVGKNQIAFTSDNPSIASFEGGVVKAVGAGTTTVHAEYMGIKVSCIVRCSFTDTGVEGNGGGVSEDGGQSGGNSENESQTVTYQLYCHLGYPVSEITIRNGETVRFSLRDSDGNQPDVKWTLAGEGATLSGNAVTGSGTGNSVVSTTYKGKTYSCLIH